MYRWPGYLISAGGVNKGLLSSIVARPITLLVDDSAQDLSEVAHMGGPCKNFTGWNNTGVFEDFAVAAGPVFVSTGWTPACQEDGWSIYAPLPDRQGLIVAVRSASDFGHITIMHDNLFDDNILWFNQIQIGEWLDELVLESAKADIFIIFLPAGTREVQVR